jgi:3-oxoacyl-[acyl-carrier protein] reductase
MKLLEGKVALITGGSRGIGEAIALKFAAEGAHIAFTYVSSDERAKALEEKLSAMGVQAKGYKSDAGDYAAAETLVNEIMAQFGTIDICVNNAGISKDNLLMRMTPEQWDDVLQANLKSIYNLSKQVIKPMMKNRKGSIINMSSIAGIIGFTKSIAQELGSRNVRVNAIAPGFIETDMTHYLKDGGAEKWFEKIPMARFGKPGEVADVALFLASDMSSYVSGQVISVCGAMNT